VREKEHRPPESTVRPGQIAAVCGGMKLRFHLLTEIWRELEALLNELVKENNLYVPKRIPTSATYVGSERFSKRWLRRVLYSEI
jgi:hypothetical protein